MPVVLAVLIVLLAAVLLLPLSLVLRFRAGRARRQARRWVARLNVAMLVLSVVMVLATAGIASLWSPGAVVYTLGGLAAGGLLGAVGLAIARWEVTPRTLHVTPNTWLILFVTFVVAARVAYGIWRTWQAWHLGLDHTSEVVAAGVRGSLAAGGIVLGYYLAFWLGVLRRIPVQPR